MVLHSIAGSEMPRANQKPPKNIFLSNKKKMAGDDMVNLKFLVIGDSGTGKSRYGGDVEIKKIKQ